MFNLVSIVGLVFSTIGLQVAGETFYSKNENIYNRNIIHDLANEEITGAADYLESIIILLESLKNGNQVTPEQLNKFSNGLNQYYLSRTYHFYFANIKPLIADESYTDPVCMPNATSEDVEFYKVKVFGYPAFKKNSKMNTDIDSSPYVKNYTIHYKGTSDVTIINGYFKIYNEQYYFIYHTYNNVYNNYVDKIRTTNGLLKPKSTTESFDAEKETFVHTYDSSEDHYVDINSTIYSKFQKIVQEVYLPKLADLVDGQLRPSYRKEDAKFAEIYRQKLLDTLIENANKYLLAKGYLPHEFSAQNLTRVITPDFTAIHIYQTKIDGYLNYERYELTISEVEGNDSVLYMQDVIRLHYPEKGDNTSTLTITATDTNTASFDQKFTIKSIDIMIAYKANLSSFPVHVYRNLEKWKFTKVGFYTKIELYNFNRFYEFVVKHAQVELAKLIGSILDA